MFYSTVKHKIWIWEILVKKSAKNVLTNPSMNGIITKLFRKRQQALRKKFIKNFAAQKNLKKVLDKKNFARYNK